MASDDDCVRFLHWALPRLGLRWAGFRKVRRQVCRRVRRRVADLGLESLEAYRDHLASEPEEWAVLDSLARITISRFYRDREVFDGLRAEVLPALARDASGPDLAVWSAGAASGEEAYTVAVIWDFELAARFAPLRLRILATDADEAMLDRARRARYTPGSVKDLPERWRQEAFDDELRLKARHREVVSFARHDVRDAPPAGTFDLVLCRYLAFTYFDAAGQEAVARAIAAALRPGGALVLGTHEELPDEAGAFEPWPARRWVYRRR